MLPLLFQNNKMEQIFYNISFDCEELIELEEENETKT